jgi:hypothetical protein
LVKRKKAEVTKHATPARRLEQKGRDTPGNVRLFLSDAEEDRRTHLNGLRTDNSSGVQDGFLLFVGPKRS